MRMNKRLPDKKIEENWWRDGRKEEVSLVGVM